MGILELTLRRDIVKRSLFVALIVGTILNIINQGDKVLTPGSVDVLKCLLTYLVPYCVATYGAVTALHQSNDAESQMPE